MRNLPRLVCLIGILLGGDVETVARAQTPDAVEQVAVGFSKRDITPTVPLRLSGYSHRDHVFDRVRDSIFTRAMAIGDGDRTCVLVSIESLAVTGDQTAKIAKRLSDDFGIDRARLVVSSTHSHTTPHPSGAIGNLFRQPMNEEQQRNLDAYTEVIQTEVLKCVGEALDNRQPADLFMGTSQANFAVNRRVIQDGTWHGFGVTPAGPTDRRVKVLLARDSDGHLLGAMFQYACHCTTLGPDFNELTGDWAGLAASQLEANSPNAVFLPVIGCGGDANPEPRTSYEDALAHGNEMTQAVQQVTDRQGLSRVGGPPIAKFGYAGLSAELPSRDELVAIQSADKSTPVQRNWATMLLEIWDSKGRLPESYPAPVHTWKFGDSLVCVFLGGEVVVDYQIRLETELKRMHPPAEVWVAAYCDDCFAYVASERMRAEGGYEVDASMLFYVQPGRWQSGTEDLLVRRVREILESDVSESQSLSPKESLRRIRVPDGMEVSLVASEPLVQDPVNLAFDADGSVWLVEMGDYPTGNESGGRVKRLRDTDGDGKFDSASVFMDGLSFPTSVMPWRDGVIVIAAPDVIFARDTDGDDRADEREVLLTGIGEANPQHRASGFDYGLDGFVYFGAGDSTKELKSHRSGQTIAADHADVRWNPDTGEIERLAGATQFVRSRDRFGRWFGNSNSLPLFHYRIDSGHLSDRNRNVQPTRLVLDPGVAPPVYPTSRTVDRFNDLFAKDRFTSACSAIILRGDGLGEDMIDTALVCEPVHNLVARFHLRPDHESLRGERFAEDDADQRDWLTSSDTWFRPVRAIEAPDGSVWVVDMARRVIEHPQWIPDAWQQQVDLRAGENLGRIYRISKKDRSATPVSLKSATEPELIKGLQSSMGAKRDLAMQQIAWRASPAVQDPVRRLMRDHQRSDIRLQAFGTLLARDWEASNDWDGMLADPDLLVAAWTLRAAARERTSAESSVGVTQILESARARLSGQTRADPEESLEAYHFELLLTLATLMFDTKDEADVVDVLERVIEIHGGQGWAIDALSLMSDRLAGFTLPLFLVHIDKQPLSDLSEVELNAREECVQTLWSQCDAEIQHELLEQSIRQRDSETAADAKSMSTSQLMLVLAASRVSVDDTKVKRLLKAIVNQARRDIRANDQVISVRARAARLLGSPLVSQSDQLDDLRYMLGIEQPGSVREAALAASYRVNAEETADLLLDAWPRLLPSERRIAGTTLLQRRSWTRKLVQAMVDGDLRLADLDSSTMSQLANCEDYWVMKTVGGLMSQPTPGERRELVDRYVREMNDLTSTEPQSLAEGERLYQETCRVCHEAASTNAGNETAAIGPSLLNLKHWDIRQWVTAILDPGANVEPKYRQYQVITASGQVFSGVVLGQSDHSVQLGLTDGRRIELLRKDLETIQDSGVSIMPEGFENKLTPAQMASIIAMLRRR